MYNTRHYFPQQLNMNQTAFTVIHSVRIYFNKMLHNSCAADLFYTCQIKRWNMCFQNFKNTFVGAITDLLPQPLCGIYNIARKVVHKNLDFLTGQRLKLLFRDWLQKPIHSKGVKKRREEGTKLKFTLSLYAATHELCISMHDEQKNMPIWFESSYITNGTRYLRVVNKVPRTMCRSRNCVFREFKG